MITSSAPLSALTDFLPSYRISPRGKVTLFIEGNKYPGLCWVADPGHAWLSVPLSLVRALGIADRISNYSYMRDGRAYLEEDRDAEHLLNALPLEFKGIRYGTFHSPRPSHVRSMARFSGGAV